MVKPLVFSYRQYEELREAYKALLDDNQKLMADNKKLRTKLQIATRIIEYNSKPNWIPCSDRLPADPGNNLSAAEYIVTVQGADKATVLLWDGVDWIDDNEVPYRVIAWMPMPDPYKEAANE